MVVLNSRGIFFVGTGIDLDPSNSENESKSTVSNLAVKPKKPTSDGGLVSHVKQARSVASTRVCHAQN